MPADKPTTGATPRRKRSATRKEPAPAAAPTGSDAEAERPNKRVIGQANLAEVISSSAGVTYWATHDRATRELGFAPREIDQGLRDTFGAA